jgi:hypothetical protein
MNYFKCKYLSFYLISLVFLVSCSSKKRTAEDLVPGDASMVMVCDMGKFFKKLAADGFGIVTKEDMTFDFIKDTFYTPLKHFTTYEDSLGVDFEGRMASAIIPLQKLEDKVPIWVTIIPLKNADTFASFLTRKGKVKFEKENEVSYGTIGTDGVLGFNKDFAVMAMKTKNQMIELPETKSVFEYTLSKDNFKDQIDYILTASKSKSIVKHKQYKKHMNDTFDVKYWMDAEYWIVNNASDDKAITNLRIYGKDALKGSSVTITQNFGKGIAESKMFFDVNDDVAKTIEKTKEKNIDSTLLKYVPGQTMLSFMGFSVNPKLISDYATLANQKNTMDFVLRNVGLKDDDIYNAITGDFISVSYIDSTLKDVPLASIAIAKITDTSKLLQLLTHEKLKNYITAVEPGIYKFDKAIVDKVKANELDRVPEMPTFSQFGNENENVIYLAYNKNVIFLTNQLTVLKSAVAYNGTNNYLQNIKKEAFQLPYYSATNIKPIYKTMLDEINKKQPFMLGKIAPALGILNVFEDAVFKGMHFKNNAFEISYAINVDDKNRNFIAQVAKRIFRFKNEIDKFESERRAAMGLGSPIETEANDSQLEQVY